MECYFCFVNSFLYSSVIIAVLIVWLKRQIESILMSFWYIWWAPPSKERLPQIIISLWEPKIKWVPRALTRVNTVILQKADFIGVSSPEYILQLYLVGSFKYLSKFSIISLWKIQNMKRKCLVSQMTLLTNSVLVWYIHI